MSLVERVNTATSPFGTSNAALNSPQLFFSSHEHFLEAIRQAQSCYEKTVVGKSFEDFFAKKFKSLKVNAQKNAHHEQQKKTFALTEYQTLFNEKLNNELTSLWSLYNNGLTGGSLESNEKPVLILGKGDLRTGKTIQNFGGLNDSESGCIFNGSWSLLKNDLMILSTIHAQKTVMLYLPYELNKEIFWNEKDNGPSMLAREIVILSAAGYTRFDHQYEEKLGYILTCTNPEKASQFTLVDACKAGESANKTVEIMRIFQKE